MENSEMTRIILEFIRQHRNTPVARAVRDMLNNGVSLEYILEYIDR